MAGNKSKFDLTGMDALYRKLNKASRFCHKTDTKAREIHKKHANNMKRQLKRLIKPASKDIYVAGKKRSPLTVEKGTYKRSIAYWKPRGATSNHVFFVGARTGAKVNPRRDAWFQLIVEQNKQWVRGNNRHAGVLTKFFKEKTPEFEKRIIADYKKHFKRLVK